MIRSMKTETNNTPTTFAGSSQFSWLERDPRQVILFAGYPFSKDYNDDRGHANALADVRATGRLNLDDFKSQTYARYMLFLANPLITRGYGINWAWKPMTRCLSMR